MWKSEVFGRETDLEVGKLQVEIGALEWEGLVRG